jgi:hypothetical protein
VDQQPETKITVITTDNSIASINASITWMNNIIIVLSASDKPFVYLIQTIQLAIVTIAIVYIASIIFYTIIQVKQLEKLKPKVNDLPR